MPRRHPWLRRLGILVVACLVAPIAIKGFLHYVKSHTLIGFGWYRIAAALAFAAWLSWARPG